MDTIWLIASGTYGEARRRKILNVFLVVALAMLVMGFAFASFQPSEEIVIIKSLGLGVIGLAGVFISVILGIRLIPDEIERRTIYTILSKPVRRYQFLCGKFLGGVLTVLANVALMGVAFIILAYLKEHSVVRDVFSVGLGVLMIFLQLTLVGAVALFFSVFVSPVVNFFLTFAVYLLGATDIFGTLAEGASSPLIKAPCALLHAIIPGFSNYNIQNPIIHPQVHVHGQGAYVGYLIVYALLYTAALLAVAVCAFDRREV